MIAKLDTQSLWCRCTRGAVTVHRWLLASVSAIGALAMTSGLAEAADPYSEAGSFSGFYVGVLGQYSHANASFKWANTKLFDEATDNWGVNGVAGYGWQSGSVYIGPEIYVDYANLSNTLLEAVNTDSGNVASLSLEREIGAGANLLAGFTGFNDSVLFYGLAGIGATNFAGRINVNETSYKGDIWYPVLSAGAGIDWKLDRNLAIRLQARHTFYIDVSDRIFPINTDQSYDFDTTSASVGLIWHPWN